MEFLTAEAQLRADVLQFCSKDAMNIHGLTPESIDELIAHDIIRVPLDVVAIPVEMIIHQDEEFKVFKRSNIPIIYKSINDAKENATAAQLFYSFCIPGITPELAQRLVTQYSCASWVLHTDHRKLIEVEGMTEELITNIVSWKIAQEKYRTIGQYYNEGFDLGKVDAEYQRLLDEKYGF